MMPTDLVARVNLDSLYPPFIERALGMLAALRDGGASFYAVCGFRSWNDQMRLYFQGRTAPGPRVTNAMGGDSAHNYGLALDLCRDGDLVRPGLQPDYQAEHYEPLRAAAGSAGLSWGGLYSSPDRPHIQWPGFDTATALAPLKKIWGSAPEGTPDDKRLRLVWNYLDAHAV